MECCQFWLEFWRLLPSYWKTCGIFYAWLLNFSHFVVWCCFYNVYSGTLFIFQISVVVERKICVNYFHLMTCSVGFWKLSNYFELVGSSCCASLATISIKIFQINEPCFLTLCCMLTCFVTLLLSWEHYFLFCWSICWFVRQTGCGVPSLAYWRC